MVLITFSQKRKVIMDWLEVTKKQRELTAQDIRMAKQCMIKAIEARQEEFNILKQRLELELDNPACACIDMYRGIINNEMEIAAMVLKERVANYQAYMCVDKLVAE